jgi:hypothetical protein
VLRTVSQYPEDRKEVRVPLDLIEHHQAAEMLEGQHWISKPCQIGRIFEVEYSSRSDCTVHELQGESGFPYLAHPQNGHNWIPSEQVL